jgi:hypothetical protein
MDQYSKDPFSELGSAAAARQRNKSRDSLFLVAKLTLAGRVNEQVRVRNLSSGGLMAELPAQVEIGTEVEVQLRGIGAIAGRVAWATDGRIGVAFDQAIDPMRARKPVTSPSRELPPRLQR